MTRAAAYRASLCPPPPKLKGGGWAAKAGLGAICAAAAPVRRWRKAADCLGWIAARASLRAGPLCGTDLGRLTGDGRLDPDPPAPAGKRRRKAPDRAVPGAATVGAPDFARLPGKAAAEAPAATPAVTSAATPAAETARALPKTLGAGPLRSLAGGDPPARRASERPVRRLRPAETAPKPVRPRAAPPKRPEPEAIASWRQAVGTRARRRVDPKPSAPGERQAARFADAPWSRPLDGPTAPEALLRRTGPAHAAPEAGSRGSPPPPAGDRARPGGAAPRWAGQAGQPGPVAPGAGSNAALSRAAAFAGLPDPAPPGDALDHETLEPPPHAAPAAWPPQPDITRPFAEVRPDAEVARLAPAQGAVADEPLATELPAEDATTAPAPRSLFDRQELTDALAQVLRDEARRHGIDV